MPNPLLLNLLRCPLCKGMLSRQPENHLACAPCQKSYPIVQGIPDLRVYEDPLISLQDDYRKSELIQAYAETHSFAELVRYYWSLPTYPPTPPDLSERFIRHVLTDEQRVEGYKDKIGRGESYLEVGCGTAATVKVVQPSFAFAVGCDIALRWLIIARKRLNEAGLPANLVCCCAEYLPFPETCFDSVASISLLEHVSDASTVINEQARVTRDGGRIFVWTTNRFSLAPEPHVRLWGVGFLPRRLMPGYVKWRSGLAYERKRLLSCFELRRLFRKARLETVRFSPPNVTEADWANLGRLERWGARVYTWLMKIPALRGLLAVFAPAIQAVAGRNSKAYDHGSGHS